MDNKRLSYSTVNELAIESGIDLVGVCRIEQLKLETARINRWQEAGYAGEMKYMNRSAELLTATEHIHKNTKSVLSCTITYSNSPHPERPHGYGRVARYAWGKDYHLILPKLLERYIKNLEKKLSRTISYRIMTDALPFLERAAAFSAGLGFIGKNTMLIRKGVGSFFFIAEIFCDVELQPELPVIDDNGCGSCSRCIDLCPTNAFKEPYTLDARRCISYLSIEKRGIHQLHEREALGEWLFGCDVCQEVCPFNHSAKKAEERCPVKDFYQDKGVGPLLKLSEVLELKSQAEFENRFKGTPLMRPGLAGLQRNALAVAANTHAAELEDQISFLTEHNPDSEIRETALWALSIFCNQGLLKDHARYVRLSNVLHNSAR